MSNYTGTGLERVEAAECNRVKKQRTRDSYHAAPRGMLRPSSAQTPSFTPEQGHQERGNPGQQLESS